MLYVQKDSDLPVAHKRTTAFQFWLRRQNWSFLYWHSMLLMAGFCLGVVAILLTRVPCMGGIAFLIACIAGLLLVGYLMTAPVAFVIALMKKYGPSGWVAGFALATPLLMWACAAITTVHFGLGIFLFLMSYFIGGVCALSSAASALRDIPQTLKEPDTLGCLAAHTTDGEASA